MGVTLSSALASGRRAAEARMLDQFDIKIATGAPVYDPATKTTAPALSLLFSTRGRVKVSGGLAAHDAEVAGRTSTTVTRELHIPVDSPAVPAGAVAVCTYADAGSDPTLLDAHLRLAGPAPGSQTTARRLEVTEVIS